MSDLGHHGEWLSLLDVSGPFLAEPVLKEVLPQGLQGLDPVVKKEVRQAYNEWREALDFEEKDLTKLHRAWISFVLDRVLGYGPDFILTGEKITTGYRHIVPENGLALFPDVVVTDGKTGGKSLLLVKTYEAHINLNEAVSGDGWAASPIEFMIELCRATSVRLGLVTNGEQWTLVDAPVGAVVSIASWYARLWSQEPLTLQAFAELLGIRRFFGGSDAELTTLLDKSLTLQDDVTDALGEQVRRAVEVLVQSLDRADQDRNRELLKDVSPEELYEAGLTIMMRIVFLLSAEERGLLLLGDRHYEANYAVSTLRGQLRQEADEVLERRWDAWSRLLSLFRAVFAGVDHGTMRMPALGGSLFNPDRFPFLEGRSKGSSWKTDTAVPLPIDNRTVLLLLEAVQLYQGRTLSYLALDVEQIGYVYEGLLERTVVRADEVTLDLKATKSAKAPWVKLSELDDAVAKGGSAVEELLKDKTGSSASRIRNDLGKTPDETESDKLLAACNGDINLRDRTRRYFNLLRTDSWGYPLVYPKGTFMVASGSDRRETGTHYTPKSLTEAIVRATLEPQVFTGPAQGLHRDEWLLKSGAALLELKICDPTMGSGAFLVQVCRFLSERLMEAWSHAEQEGKYVTALGVVLDELGSSEPISRSMPERLLTAQRLIAEKCLYGVDANPLAVSLAKLSIWLFTLAKNRPFEFLDHNLRCGDSLIGLRSLEQIHTLEILPDEKSSKKLFAHDVDTQLAQALKLRLSLRARNVQDIRDVEIAASLDSEARQALAVPFTIADTIVATALDSGVSKYDSNSVSLDASRILNRSELATDEAIKRNTKTLNDGQASSVAERRPLHWPLEFPEVFLRENGGFDALLGNPPFMGGRKISSALGAKYSRFIKDVLLPGDKGSINLVMFFLLQGAYLCRQAGTFGFIATDTISESDTREVGLVKLFSLATPVEVTSSRPWPGSASVRIAILGMFKGCWTGEVILDGEKVNAISTMLQSGADLARSVALKQNVGRCSDGVKVQGIGFVLSDEEARNILDSSTIYGECLSRYIVGDDINNNVQQLSDRWVINFWDRSEEQSRKFPLLWKILNDRVKPYRDGLTKQVHEACFWKFWDRREEFFNKVRKKSSVLVLSKLSKYIMIASGDPGHIYSEKVKVFDLSSFSAFCVLQSCFHEVWAHTWGSSTGETPAYVGSSCFDTFPFPAEFYAGDGYLNDVENSALQKIGMELYEHRRKIGLARSLGLTDIYNLYHNVDCNDHDVQMLRMQHDTLNTEVARAYGWGDLDVKASFRVQDGRYAIPQELEKSLLERLTGLNHAMAKS